MTRKRNTGATRTDVRSGARGVPAGRDINANILNTGNYFANAFIVDRRTASEILAKLESPTASEPDDRLAELSRLAGQVKIAARTLGQLYRECLPPHETPVKLTNLSDILLDLSERPLLTSNRLPLLEFVARLARLDAAAVVRDGLHAWLRQAEADFGPGPAPAAEEATRPVTTSAPPAQAVLEVQLTPDPDNPNRSKGKLYLVEVSLWRSDVGYLPTFRSPLGNDPLPLDKVPELLADVLDNSGSLRQVGHLTDLTFEFILPLDLLSHAVDRWKPREGPVPLGDTYGTIHPLVVRSLDRMKFYATSAYAGTQLYDLWVNKWRAFRETAAPRNGGTLRWLRLDGADQRKLIEALQNDQDAHCLGLPDPADERALGALIWAGVPVALWARAAGPAAPGGQGLQDLLKPALGAKTLAELPASIRTARGTAAGQSYPHNCLALLWDDPTRLPVRYRPEGVFRDEPLASVQGQR